MNRTVTLKEIAGGYALAGITLCLGVYLGIKAGKEDGGIFLKSFYVLAVLITLNFTFAWGRLRGFAARREDGSIAVAHVVRNLVMSGIVWMCLIFLFAPLAMLAFRLAR